MKISCFLTQPPNPALSGLPPRAAQRKRYMIMKRNISISLSDVS